MNPFPVPSTVLSGWDYDTATSQLSLSFTDGAIYSYTAVPAQIVEALLRAPSPGKFFNTRIRRNFLHRQINAPLS